MGISAANWLRGLQVFLASANLALAAYVYHWFISSDNTASPAALIFLIFAPSFSLLSLGYMYLSTPSLITLGIEGGNSIFYFAGFIAYALFLTDLVVCDGASCTLARATAVIAAAEFSAWISSTILTAKDWFRTEETKDAILRRQMRQEQAGLP